MKSSISTFCGVVAFLVALVALPNCGRAAGNAYDEPISYTISGSYTAISGSSSNSISVTVNSAYSTYSQTASVPSGVSTMVSDYADNVTVVDVTVNNASAFALTIAIKPIYDVFINGVMRNTYTVSNLDGSGQPISGAVTYHVPISFVRKWLGESLYLAPVESIARKMSLGEVSSVVLPQSIATKEDTVRPTLTFGMGLAKNGMPLPPLRVYLDFLPNWGYPDVPDMAPVTKSSTITWVQVPQVTAIVTTQAQYGNLAAGQTLTVAFALPGQEGSPFVTYTFTTVSASNTADGGYTEQIRVQKVYSDNPVQYQTDVTTTVVRYPPPAYNFPQYYSANISYKDWHATPSSTAPRNVSLTTTASNSSFVSAVYQADDGGTNVATSTRYDYTLVTSNVNGQGGFSMRWVRSKVTEAYGAQNYVSTTLFSGSDYYEAGRTDTLGGTTWWTFSTDGGYTAGMYPGTKYSPWNNNVPVFNGSTTGCRVTQFGYGSDWGGTPVVTSKTDKVNGVTIASEAIQYGFTGDAAGDNYTLANGLNIVATTKTTTILGNVTQQQITKTYRPDNTDSLYQGVPYSVRNPDGSMVSYAYERGTYTGGSSFSVQAGGPDLLITKFSGIVPGGSGATTVSQTTGGTAIDPIGMVPNRSTINIEIWRRDLGSPSTTPADGARFLLRDETDLYTGSASTLLTYEQYEFSNGRLKTRTAGNGVTVSTTWNGDQKASEVDELGRTHTFAYDTAGRLSTESVSGVTTAPYGSGTLPVLLTTFGYDADNRVTSRKVGPTSGEQVTTATVYDTGGRILQTTDPRGIVTNFIRSNGDQTVQETYGDNGTKITTRQPDGRTASVTGTAVLNEFYTYGVDAQGRPYTKTNVGSATGRSKTSYYDLIGREVETDTASFGSGGASSPLAVNNTFNSNGWLQSTHAAITGGGAIAADTLKFYDALGAVTDEGLDINGDGQLTVSSTDRYVHHTTAIGSNALYSGQWLKTTSAVYTANNAGDSYQTEVDTQVGAFPTNVQSSTVSYDRYQNATTTTVTIDPSNHWAAQVVKAPDGSSAAKYTVEDRVLAEASFDSTGAVLGWVSYTYDAQGRLVGTQDSRKGTATNVYYTGSTKLNLSRDATQATVVTYSTYDGVGRPTKVLDALGNDTQFVYDPLGHVTQQSGAGAMPVQYDYNSYGEKIAMRTYRHGLASAADWTNWVYDANTGWLTTKIDAAATRDSSGNVTNATGHQVTYNYIYDFTNRVQSTARTSERGTVRTEKRSLVTGDLVGVAYVDQSGVTTPPTTYIYTRDGQLWTATDATGTRNFIYSSGDLAAEALDPTFYRGAQNGLVETINRESATSVTNHTIFGRSAGYSLGYVLTAGSTADLDDELSATVGYDGASRIKTVAAAYKAQGARAASSTSFTYTYNAAQAPAARWYQLQQGAFSVTHGFEAHRDIMNSVKAVSATGTITDFELQKDSAGRAQYIVQSGYAYADYGSAIHVRYAYDSIGNLQGATAYLGSDGTSTANPLPGMGLAYTYDTFGNRSTAAIDGVSVNYTDGAGNNGGNALNEIGQRGTLPTHVSGTIMSGSSVTANGISATVLGNYWDVSLPVSAGGAYYAQLPVAATNGGQSANTTLAALLRPSSETYSYDADGNLLLDSLWSYTWDAEDRLIGIAANSVAVGFGAPNYSLTFKYDYLGRRVQKTVLLNGVKTFDRKYVYQGSLLVAELDAGTNQLVQSYTWGQDLSGSIGGAGGIGGLLLVTSETSTALSSYDVTYDGNGNVTALLSIADGSLAAAYEYDPYGQMVRRQGVMAQRNPFEFSTKYTDIETGLVYYGRRYYDSSAGRFVNRDPSEEAGGLNLFRFVNGDPIDQFDAFGLDSSSEQAIATNSQFDMNQYSWGDTNAGYVCGLSPIGPEIEEDHGRYTPAAKKDSRKSGKGETKENEDERTKKRLKEIRDRMEKAADDWRKSHSIWNRLFGENKYEDAVAAVDRISEQINNESNKNNDAPNNAPPADAPVRTATSSGSGGSGTESGRIEKIDAGRYHILTDGKRVNIVVKMQYAGAAATPDVIAKFNAGIAKYWTGQSGKYEVRMFVQTVSDGSGFYPIVETRLDGGAVANGRGSWDPGVGGWDAAHEVAHWLTGDGDHYGHAPDYTPDRGYENSIMGGRGLSPNEADIDRVLNLARYNAAHPVQYIYGP
jgi:RHS repeat-associated protein